MKKIAWLLIILLLGSCSKKLKEIPITEIPEDLKWIADQTAQNIIEFCDNDEALKEFNQRSSVKSRMQKTAGKHLLTCMMYVTEVKEINEKELYKVNRLKGNVKRFKYKLSAESETFDLMELHVDINSDKFLATYSFFGRNKEGKWISILHEMERDARKFLKGLK